MRAEWLHREKRAELIVFCNGWGMDSNPFQPLSSVDYDVYMLYDYQNLTPPADLQHIVESYRRVHLISWSMGVWVGQKIFADVASHFGRTIAINGTLCPISDRWGIPVKTFQETLNGFNETAQMKFYRRMCREKTNLKMFLSRQPQRSHVEQRNELASLEESVVCLLVDQSIYQEIIIAEYDWVVPSENQRQFWLGKQITEIAGFHFLFYLWQSWDHLLIFADSTAQR
jgi:pimeloyl-[acyl-carrier protein] methyl ester esterase